MAPGVTTVRKRAPRDQGDRTPPRRGAGGGVSRRRSPAVDYSGKEMARWKYEALNVFSA
jgi:hypothetical protein